ncbi:MAG: penicillin-binding protein 1B [Reinekea sp.]
MRSPIVVLLIGGSDDKPNKDKVFNSSYNAAPMTKKSPTRREPKASKRKSTRKQPGQTSYRQKALRLTIQLSLIAACLLLFWVINLNAVVREKFEGRRFQIPARVYSEAQEVYAGAAVRQAEFMSLLQQLGYRRSATAFQAGRYSVLSNQVNVYSRGFRFWDGEEPSQLLKVRFDGDGVSSVVDSNNKNVILARLDPLYLGQIYPGVTEDRVLYSLENIPETLVLGLLLIEDDRFFEHYGVSIRGIVRALAVNVMTGKATQGGSTLTNQLVKNLYLSSEKKLTRKINEAIMSLILEFHYSKNEILETYMNEVYIGQQGARSINGFGLGAEFYFGTTLQGLEIHQQALLVGLIKGPSFYNPRRHPERAKKRRDLVLGKWHEEGLIDEAEYQHALAEPLDVANKPGQASYPAFMDALRRQLNRDYRKNDLMVEGLSIYTTLDPVAQQALETVLSSSVSRVEDQYGLGANVLEGAAVLTRPSTGDILAMVGGRDAKASGFNRALDAIRPVGSLMKPAVYLAALEQGHTLSEMISDDEVAVSARDGSVWSPRNYDHESHGQVMLLDALAKSYNQATARLGMQVGLANVFDVIDRLGVSGDIPKVPSVMLGAHGMSAYQVAQMYQTIAGNGFYSPLNLVRAVSHPEYGVIQRYALQVSQRFEPKDIYLLQEAMHEVTQHGTAARIHRQLPPRWWVAGKTGTTDDNRDAWFAGFTGDRQLVVWVGRDDNQPTPLTGSTGALPIWIQTMKVLNPLPERRGVPANIVFESVNSAGVKVPSWCDDVRQVPFVKGTEPEKSLSCSSQVTQPRQKEEKDKWWKKLLGRS